MINGFCDSVESDLDLLTHPEHPARKRTANPETRIGIMMFLIWIKLKFRANLRKIGEFTINIQRIVKSVSIMCLPLKGIREFG
jgi:hypothetical protein